MTKNALKKSGTVRYFNISPKGNHEGLLLESRGDVIQINFPQEWSVALADLATPGTHIHVEVEQPEQDHHACHPVYQLLSVSNDKQEKFPANKPNGHFSGTVKRLNYALHGEVNGAVLDSGDFLHLKPHGAAAVDLTVGLEVNGTGSTKPMIGGHYVIEADEVNGIPLEKKPKPKKKVHK